MTIPRWNTLDTGSDLYLIECGNVVVGSVARLGPADIWRVEILWSGAEGDITAEFNSYGKALCFIQGVEMALRVMRGAVPTQPLTVTVDDVPSCGQENDYRRASPEPDTSDIPEVGEDWFKAAKLRLPKE